MIINSIKKLKEFEKDTKKKINERRKNLEKINACVMVKKTETKDW